MGIVLERGGWQTPLSMRLHLVYFLQDFASWTGGLFTSLSIGHVSTRLCPVPYFGLCILHTFLLLFHFTSVSFESPSAGLSRGRCLFQQHWWLTEGSSNGQSGQERMLLLTGWEIRFSIKVVNFWHCFSWIWMCPNWSFWLVYKVASHLLFIYFFNVWWCHFYGC